MKLKKRRAQKHTSSRFRILKFESTCEVCCSCTTKRDVEMKRDARGVIGSATQFEHQHAKVDLTDQGVSPKLKSFHKSLRPLKTDRIREPHRAHLDLQCHVSICQQFHFTHRCEILVNTHSNGDQPQRNSPR